MMPLCLISGKDRQTESTLFTGINQSFEDRIYNSPQPPSADSWARQVDRRVAGGKTVTLTQVKTDR